MKTDANLVVDTHVGTRVRMRRVMLGVTQEALAGALGVTFQQVQKYEKGTNRISASRLQHISQILQVPVPFFFDGAPGGVDGTAVSPILRERISRHFRWTGFDESIHARREREVAATDCSSGRGLRRTLTNHGATWPDLCPSPAATRPLTAPVATGPTVVDQRDTGPSHVRDRDSVSRSPAN
jgi:transcriptional regulator with XRE-family HTH domain